MYNTSYKELIQSTNLIASLDIISDSEQKTISVIPVGSLYDVESILSGRIYGTRKVQLITSNNGASLFELIISDKESGKRVRSGEFILYKYPDFLYTYLIITFEESNFFHRELRPFVKNLYTEVILPFIKSRELISLIDNYRQLNQLSEIIITRASQKIRYHEELSMSTVTWNNSNLEDADLWLQENNGWFKSIQFKALLHGREVSTTFIHRNGIVRTARNFSKVFDSLIFPNCIRLEEYVNLFKNRSRRDNLDLEVRPIVIEYSESIFKDISNNKKFIQSVSSLTSSSVSVLHGNPYIHLAVVDYNDASTYDLWVLDDNKLLITPQLHCSINSLKRLVTHIYDTYAEGELKDYEI